MVLTSEERAARVLESFEGTETLHGLEALIASAIREAVEEERRGVRTTLGQCIDVFDRVPDQSGGGRARQPALSGWVVISQSEERQDKQQNRPGQLCPAGSVSRPNLRGAWVGVSWVAPRKKERGH